MKSCSSSGRRTALQLFSVTHDLEEAIALADKVYVLTAGPATVKSVYEINLPRPRHVADIPNDKDFVALSKRIWADLKDEVLKAQARATVAA